MGRVSARSNPTGLKDIDRGRVMISVTENGGSRSFTLNRLDLKDTGLGSDLKVVVVARAGNTSIRYEMGQTGTPTTDSQALNGLDRSQPLRFRILLHAEDNPKLVASIEELRARDDLQSESLLPMEAAELGERLWNLVLAEEGPILQFNSAVFPSAAGAENYTPFGALVLPEALRQVMAKIAHDPGCLADENDPWHSWGSWLDSIGIPRPEDIDDDDEKTAWCNQAVDLFCNRFRFATRLGGELLAGGEHA